MPPRSGIGGQVGIAAEVTFGTYQAAGRFLQTKKASLKKVLNTVAPQWLGAGRLMDLDSAVVVTTRAGGGSIDLEVVNKGFGLLLQALMGTSVTPVQQASTTAYLQTHTLADSFGKSLSIQSGIPDVSTGTVRPYTFLGAKVTDATFTVEVDKAVEASFNIDAQDVVESQTIATASYGTGIRPFVGATSSIKVGAFGSEASVTGVKKVTVKIDRNLGTDRFYLGAAGLKAEQLLADMAGVTGTISADYIDKTIWADRFASNASFSLVLECLGPIIQSSFAETFRITLPACRLDGDTPILDGPDVVNGDFPFTCRFDGTNYPKIEYMSVDTVV